VNLGLEQTKQTSSFFLLKSQNYKTCLVLTLHFRLIIGGKGNLISFVGFEIKNAPKMKLQNQKP